mmetsp:Transcript_33332/g.95793  ORF Transcript_33332/g.95793 Transcript_33332/m.95793 type:complete len:229 (-) Transcript_33332:96-782(-)
MASSAAIEYGTRGPMRVLPASTQPGLGQGPTLLGAQHGADAKPMSQSIFMRALPTESVVQTRATSSVLRAVGPQARSTSPPPVRTAVGATSPTGVGAVTPLKLLSRAPPNPARPTKFRPEDARMAAGRTSRQGSPPPAVLLTSPKGGIRTGPVAPAQPAKYTRPNLHVGPMLIAHHSHVERQGALHATGARLWQRARSDFTAVQALSRVLTKSTSAGVFLEPLPAQGV